MYGASLIPANAAIMGRRILPITELTALVKSLGGYIFVPGTETYADQSALAPAASALDSQVGYVGSAATQGVGENFVKNSEMAGATSSTLGTNWTKSAATNNVTFTQSGYGVDSEGTYTEFTASGIAGGSTAWFGVYPNGALASGNHPAAIPGQLWSAQQKFKQVSGTSRTAVVQILETQGATSLAKSQSSSALVVGTTSAITHTRRLTNTATTYAMIGTFISVDASSGDWAGNVFRIYAPQLERGHPTEYTPTYGTAISRGVFASAAQATLANTPILRAGGLLEFDGSTDHLITDITSSSSGYMLSVFRQDEAFGGMNALIGNCYGSGTSSGEYLRVENTGYVKFIKYDTSGNIANAVTPTIISIGKLTIVDASWSPTSISIRKDGGTAGTSTDTVNPVGTGIMLIGARNTAKDGAIVASEFMQGALGIQIIIPNVTLPTATEQRIRQLVGQIYGVSTL